MSLKNLLEQLVDSTKFDLFYDVWVEKNILETLGKLGTQIWFSPNFNHTRGF